MVEFLKQVKFLDDNNQIIYSIDDEFFETHESRMAFIKGIFIGCSTSNIVLDDVSKSGYHLEFVFSNYSPLQI